VLFRSHVPAAGLLEDSDCRPEHEIEPGTIIDIRAPIWRVAECLEHARILSRLLAPDEDFRVLFRGRWAGLAGRQLGSFDPMQSFFMRDDYTSRQDEFTVRKTLDLGQIADNLPEIILSLLAPLYERFRFFELTMDLVRDALARRWG